MAHTALSPDSRAGRIGLLPAIDDFGRQIMAAPNVNKNDAPSEHIGPAPHAIRNLLIAGSLMAMVAVLGVSYWNDGRAETAAAAELSQFRQAMFNRCGGEQFSGAADPKFEDLYADSSRIREVVVKQFHQLQRPNTDCTEVTKALRSVDYPIR
jgi:hypothetical protein